jgi:hypothetical protein
LCLLRAQHVGSFGSDSGGGRALADRR